MNNNPTIWLPSLDKTTRLSLWKYVTRYWRHENSPKVEPKVMDRPLVAGWSIRSHWLTTYSISFPTNAAGGDHDYHSCWLCSGNLEVSDVCWRLNGTFQEFLIFLVSLSQTTEVFKMMKFTYSSFYTSVKLPSRCILLFSVSFSGKYFQQQTLELLVIK